MYSFLESSDTSIDDVEIHLKKMVEIGKAANDEANSIEGNVSEMFKGRTYVLFRYRMIKNLAFPCFINTIVP